MPGRRGSLLALLAVLLVGLNLRGPIAAVAPVVDGITDELALSPAEAGLLTTLPVLCFAAAAPLAALLGRLLGPVQAVAGALVVLAAALVVRVLTGSAVLLVGTVVVGVALTVGNVLLPVVIKRDFPGRSTTVTALYTATLAGGAALTAALAAPMADAWGWRAALGGWGALAAVSLGLWGLAFARRPGRLGAAGGPLGAAGRALGAAGGPRGAAGRALGAARGPLAAAGAGATPGPGPPAPPAPVGSGGAPLWRQSTAWAVSLVLGFQSALYYTLTSWLPLVLQDEAGLGRAAAGNAMSLFQLLGIPGTLVVPALCRRRPSQAWLGVVLGAGWLVTVGGLLLLPQAWLAWCVVGGLTQGMGISFAFSLVVLRAVDAAAVRGLSAMSQFVGYGVGAVGPVAVGSLRAATGGWSGPLVLLLATTVLLVASGTVAGRDRPVVSAAPS